MKRDEQIRAVAEAIVANVPGARIRVQDWPNISVLQSGLAFVDCVLEIPRESYEPTVDSVGVGIVGPRDANDPSFFVDSALAMNDIGSGYGEGCADE